MVVLDRIDRIPTRLVFTTGIDPFQFFVRTGTQSPATHAALALGPDGDQLLHAYEAGVRLEPRDLWFGQQDQKLIAEFQILPDVTEGVFRAMQHVGKPYDTAHVIKIAFLRLLGRSRLGKPEGDDAFTCARFVMAIDPNGITIPEWRGLSPEAVVPADLLDAAQRGDSFCRIA